MREIWTWRNVKRFIKLGEEVALATETADFHFQAENAKTIGCLMWQCKIVTGRNVLKRACVHMLLWRLRQVLNLGEEPVTKVRDRNIEALSGLFKVKSTS
jgi:hypothetical protein